MGSAHTAGNSVLGLWGASLWKPGKLGSKILDFANQVSRQNKQSETEEREFVEY
jgi:hypothetical protein